MKKKRNLVIVVVCITVLLSILAVVGVVYSKRARDKNLLTEADSTIRVQQINMDIPKEEQSEIANQEDFEDKFISQGEEKQIEGSNTYKINNDKCSISFDSGESWVDIPLEMKELCNNEGGYSYKNKLQDGSYLITPKYTVIAYGGLMMCL